jgi:hypothetical protein
MKITTIDYERLFSLGQYENERIGLHAEVDPGTENIFDAFKDLKATVLSLQKEGLIIEEPKKVAETERPKEPVKPTLDEIQSLKSQDKTSEKGAYQLIQKSDNQSNPAFEKLQSYIKEHKGFCQLHSFKAWIFSNDPEKIGIRKQ